MATVLALLMVMVLLSVAAGMAASGSTTLQQSTNVAAAESAQLQAESGLSYLIYQLNGMEVAGGPDPCALLSAVAAELAARLDGSASLCGGAISYDPNDPNDPNTLTIPNVSAGVAGSFGATLTALSSETFRLVVTGRNRTISRRLGVNLAVQRNPGGGFFGDYGIASRGKVSMTGNARIRGANNPGEAHVLAATFSQDEAINLTGNCRIEGDLSISNPDGYASLTGNVSVGGVSASSDEVLDHIHVGTGEVDFPEVDPAAFESFATNVVDASTSTSGNVTFENIRILANTNKTFSGNITLKGVIFVEVPNQIHFSGNLDLTGVLVTQDAGDGAYESNTVKFSGNTTVRGVEQLPDQPQFAQLRQMPGAFLLAPGFGAEFVGNFGTVSGCMAADQFKFTGNAGGTVKGGIISYGDSDFNLVGNSSITIDRSGTPDVPPGFRVRDTYTLSVTAGSYNEY